MVHWILVRVFLSAIWLIHGQMSREQAHLSDANHCGLTYFYKKAITRLYHIHLSAYTSVLPLQNLLFFPHSSPNLLDFPHSYMNQQNIFISVYFMCLQCKNAHVVLVNFPFSFIILTVFTKICFGNIILHLSSLKNNFSNWIIVCKMFPQNLF